MDSTPSEIYEVTRQVAAAFEKAGIRYFLGGSVASALYGEARSTRDIDLVAAMFPHHVEPFLGALGGGFYADAQAIGQAVAARRSFNLVHLDTMVKVDVFVAGTQPFQLMQFRRRVLQTVSADGKTTFYVASPEDTILAKLQWYRDGGGVSERQWNDVLGVLKVQAPTLDRTYLREWGRELCLTDLLQRAFDDAGWTAEG